MKGKVKRYVVTLLCATMMGAPLMFTGCEKTSAPTPEPEPEPEKPPIEAPIDPKPTWTTEEFDEFVAIMGSTKNYRYSITENGKTNFYDIDGDIVRFREDGDRRGTYWYSEEGKCYQLAYCDDSKNKKKNSE